MKKKKMKEMIKSKGWEELKREGGLFYEGNGVWRKGLSDSNGK